MVTIVWDVDDVLNDLMYQWFTHCWLRGPGCKLSFEELNANPPTRFSAFRARTTLILLTDSAEPKSNSICARMESLSWLRGYGPDFGTSPDC